MAKAVTCQLTLSNLKPSLAFKCVADPFHATRCYDHARHAAKIVLREMAAE